MWRAQYRPRGWRSQTSSTLGEIRKGQENRFMMEGIKHVWGECSYRKIINCPWLFCKKCAWFLLFEFIFLLEWNIIHQTFLQQPLEKLIRGEKTPHGVLRSWAWGTELMELTNTCKQCLKLELGKYWWTWKPRNIGTVFCFKLFIYLFIPPPQLSCREKALLHLLEK